MGLIEFTGNEVGALKEQVQRLCLRNFGRENFFSLKTKWLVALENVASLTKSYVNNYYESTMLSRLSVVLSLCSKAYVVCNDYKNIRV